jgi:hypothetical protein
VDSTGFLLTEKSERGTEGKEADMRRSRADSVPAPVPAPSAMSECSAENILNRDMLGRGPIFTAKKTEFCGVCREVMEEEWEIKEWDDKRSGR